MTTIQRQNEIDLLRIIAALVVFIFHYTDSFNYMGNIVPGNLYIGRYFRYGYLGVHLFFMISGYVVTMSAMNKKLRQFWLSRISRLYPAFWISCIIAMILPRLYSGLPAFITYPTLKLFLFNLTMVPSVFHQKMLSPVYWSLLEEMHFYLVISFIIAFKLWNRLLLILVIWLLVYIGVGVAGKVGSDETVGFLVPKHSLYFIAGMLFYMMRISYADKKKLHALLLIVFGLCIGYCFSLAQYTNKLYQSTNAVNMYVYFGINTAMFLVFYLISIGKFTIRSSRVLQVAGDLTYPFYLVHVFGLGLYWFLRNELQPQLLLLLMLALLLAISYAINRFLEKPAIRWVRQLLTRLFRKKKAITLPSEK